MTDQAAVVAPKARPGLWLNLLVAWEVLQGLLFTLVGVVLVLARNDAEVRVDLEGSSSGVAVAGGVIATIGLIHLLAAVGLLRRSDLVRSLLAVLATLQGAAAVYALISRQDARLPGAFPFVSAAAILWILYGSERSQRFFER